MVIPVARSIGPLQEAVKGPHQTTPPRMAGEWSHHDMVVTLCAASPDANRGAGMWMRVELTNVNRRSIDNGMWIIGGGEDQ